MVIFWVVLIAGMVWAGALLVCYSDSSGTALAAGPTEILDRRLASGEIDAATYDTLRAKLRTQAAASAVHRFDRRADRLAVTSEPFAQRACRPSASGGAAPTSTVAPSAPSRWKSRRLRLRFEPAYNIELGPPLDRDRRWHRRREEGRRPPRPVSRGNVREMHQNLSRAIGYNSLALPIAVGVFEPIGLTPQSEIAAISMADSSVLVATAILALKWLRLPGETAADG